MYVLLLLASVFCFITVVTLYLLTARHYLDYIGVIPVVVMEFVGGGCLRTFLNNMKRAHSDHSKTKRDFVLYGKQIAEGMDYLVSSTTMVRC